MSGNDNPEINNVVDMNPPEGTTSELGRRGVELALDSDEPWQMRAHCLDADPDAFFPEKGGSTREAKRVCVQCPVREECLEYALENNERFGIWGGMSKRERRRLRRKSAR